MFTLSTLFFICILLFLTRIVIEGKPLNLSCHYREKRNERRGKPLSLMRLLRSYLPRLGGPISCGCEFLSEMLTRYSYYCMLQWDKDFNGEQCILQIIWN